MEPPRPDLVARAIVPDYALGPHTASLGLASPERIVPAVSRGMFVGQHGSWNRKPRSGYKVIFVPFTTASLRPAGRRADGLRRGRRRCDGAPRGRRDRKRGALLVADDVGNIIWRVTAAERSIRAESN